MDVKALVDWGLTNGSSLLIGILVFVGLGLALSSGPAKRVGRAIEETFFSNWQLALLATTSIVLSLVAGYTTFDGLRNFTGGGVLSLMATIGIQGVMLVTAWLIGESFASGMNQKSESGSGGWDLVATALFALLAMIAATMWFGQTGTETLAATTNWFDSRTAQSIQNFALYGAMTALVLALVIAMTKSDIGSNYIQSFRVIIKNSILWVMFLACMSTSVFFSFDSHFSGIFPQSERVRASELRAQNQVAGIVSDIGSSITEKRLVESETLFTSDGWRAYDDGLAALAKAAQSSGAEIETYFNAMVEDKNRAIKQQQERITTAQSSQAGLQSRKVSLTDELSRLEADRPSLAADYAEKKTALDARAKEVDAKRVEAMAEEKGVEGTGKVGRGQIYRQRLEELGKLQDYIKVGEERVKDSKKRLDSTETRIAQIKRELAAVDGDLAKYKGETETAQSRIQLAQENALADPKSKLDPSRLLPQFEIVRGEFRQEPTAERLAKLQQACSQIYSAMATATPETKKKVAGIDCDPKQASEAAALVFALNSGSETFAKTCAGGEKLVGLKTTDELFGFAARCLADSGLPSKETDQLRNKINFIELNRDDKAHRFVVTWNAFNDGNRLAYLALAIAITIDSLVFMSGLFGANAIRSPLSDVPTSKARSARQLEAIIENALLPDTFANAKMVLGALHPITNIDGFVAEVDIRDVDPETAARLREVLSAGATIGAVKREGASYHVREELMQFLAIVAKRSYDKNRGKFTEDIERSVKSIELDKMVAAALLPDIAANSDIVLGHFHPISEEKGFPGFASEVLLSDVDEADKRLVRNVLNAGSTFQLVHRFDRQDSPPPRYIVHADLYKTLARIRARGFGAGYGQGYLAGPGRGGARDGGALSGGTPRIAPPQQKALPAQSPAQPQAPVAQAPQAQAPRANDPDRTPDPGPDGFPANAALEHKRGYVAALVSSLGIEPELFLDLSGEAFGAAVAASEAFDRARQSNQLLDRGLTERDEQARVQLEKSFSRIDSQLQPSDARERQILVDAYTDVDQNWLVIMMLPGGPYESLVQSVVEILEEDDGGGRLPAEKKELLRLAKRLHASLATNRRDNADAWQRLSHALGNQFGSGQAQAGFDGGKRTLN